MCNKQQLFARFLAVCKHVKYIVYTFSTSILGAHFILFVFDFLCAFSTLFFAVVDLLFSLCLRSTSFSAMVVLAACSFCFFKKYFFFVKFTRVWQSKSTLFRCNSINNRPMKLLLFSFCLHTTIVFPLVVVVVVVVQPFTQSERRSTNFDTLCFFPPLAFLCRCYCFIHCRRAQFIFVWLGNLISLHKAQQTRYYNSFVR